MKKGFWIFFFIAMAINVTASASSFYACKSKYALCTTAACQPIAGKTDVVSCRCDVKTGYSAATQDCKPVEKSEKGEVLYSRYYPVKSYVSCSNDRPWAWCLDKTCYVDPKNPSKAFCECSVVSNLGPYVIVANKNTPMACTTGVISSATIDQITEITDFLKTQSAPKPYPIKVFKGQ
jgi:hypothetical protein